MSARRGARSPARALGLALAACLLLGATPSLHAQSRTLAIRGGTVHTVADGVIADGVVLVRDGRIAAVGADVDVPADAEVIDAAGRIVTPGIVDARSEMGIGWRDAGDRERLAAPAREIADHYDGAVDDEWLRSGVTAVYLAPDAGNLLGGFGAVVKLAGERGRVVHRRAAMSASFGESALDAFDSPTTRQGMVAELREAFIAARDALDDAAAADAADPAVRALGRVLAGDVPLRIYANSPDDITTALRVAREFDIDAVIDSGAGAHAVADALAAADVPVVVGPSIIGLGGGGPFEMFAHSPDNAARLHRAGVALALSTESGGGRSVVVEGLVAKAHGLPEAAALRAVTLDAAEILGVADRLGSIEPGKAADLVIWDGHPLSTWGESRVVIVDGRVVFEREPARATS